MNGIAKGVFSGNLIGNILP